MATGNVSAIEEVRIRAHYERFPATIKGAFVLRGVARDPHQVHIESAWIVGAGGEGRRRIDMESVTLEVAPNLDQFVPFELPVTELAPGWYRLECNVTIDGSPEVVRPEGRFSVAWPRGAMRRGSVSVRRVASTADAKVRIDELECAPDSVVVTYSAPKAASMKLAADGDRVAEIDNEFDEETQTGRLTAYPVAKQMGRLSIQVKGADPIEVRLP
jgi:hypothetical protein